MNTNRRDSPLTAVTALTAVTILFLSACLILVPQRACGEWQAHQIRQADGQGSWVARAALWQVLKHPDSEFTMPFSLCQMDNGEIALLVSREQAKPGGGRIVESNIAFSKDGGRTWNLDRRYELDGFDFLREDGYWLDCKVGHTGAIALPNGDMLCVYGDYRQGAVLIKWRPDGNLDR